MPKATPRLRRLARQAMTDEPVDSCDCSFCLRTDDQPNPSCPCIWCTSYDSNGGWRP